MTEPAFPPHIAAALDRLTAPPLPANFGERLLARIEAGDLPADADSVQPPLPTARRRFGMATGWRRSGRIVAGITAFGLATATAAASGFFGEPVYVPVVSETLAKAKLVDLPKSETVKPKPKPKPAAEQIQPVEPPPAVATVETAKGKAAVRDLYKRLLSDPEYRALPRPQRVAIARKELRTMLQNGDVTLDELRQMLRQSRQERLAAGKPAFPPVRERALADAVRESGAASTQTSVERPVRPIARPVIDPAKAEARRETFRQIPAEQRARLRELREQLRSAPPAERPAIRHEIRSIWRSIEQPPAEKIGEPGEGNPEVVR